MEKLKRQLAEQEMLIQKLCTDSKTNCVARQQFDCSPVEICDVRQQQILHRNQRQEMLIEKSLFDEIDCAMREIVDLRDKLQRSQSRNTNEFKSLKERITELEGANEALKCQSKACNAELERAYEMVDKLKEKLDNVLAKRG